MEKGDKSPLWRIQPDLDCFLALSRSVRFSNLGPAVPLGAVSWDKSARHGKGLIANQDIPKGQLVHITHVWSSEYKAWANVVPDCMYNHSKTKENSEIKTRGKTKSLFTSRDIKKGEELFTDYTKDKDLEQPEDGWKE